MSSKRGKSTKKVNKHEQLFDLLATGPKSRTELIAVVPSYAARISEWNKVYCKVQIKNIDGRYQLVRTGRILVDHKKAYPTYYTEEGKYEWPALRKKNQEKKVMNNLLKRGVI